MKKGDLKECTKCGEEKPATTEYFNFSTYKRKSGDRGLRGACKCCDKENKEVAKERSRKYYKENKEKCDARNKKYYQEHREDCISRQKKYVEENLEKHQIYRKKYQQENKEKIKAFKKEYYEKNREEIERKRKKHYKENWEEIQKQKKKYRRTERAKATRKKWTKRRLKEDPVFRLITNMRKGLCAIVSGKRKRHPTMQYIGMTSDELMDYLEDRFTEGMTRDNYGKWHVDHERPLASFDFTGQDREEQLHIAWHHTNLQPLWAKDNLSKGAKYEEG